LDEENPRDKRGLVAAFFDNGTLFFAAEVAVGVAKCLDFEGEGSNATRFRLLGGPISTRFDATMAQDRKRLEGRGFQGSTQEIRVESKKLCLDQKVIFPTTKKGTFPVLKLVGGTYLCERVHKKQKDLLKEIFFMHLLYSFVEPVFWFLPVLYTTR
jgi:hypothetical protein